MIKTPTFNKGKPNNNQPSILGFVETPDYNTGKNRVPHPSKKSTDQQHQRGSSSNSKTRKRKHSTVQNQDSTTKKIIMDKGDCSENVDLQAHVNNSIPTLTPSDPITAALHEMEAKLTKNMKEMIDPFKVDISALVKCQKEWEQQRVDVQDLKVEKTRLNHKIREVEEINLKLEARVCKLEDKLLESNFIIHGIKESKWELDSTRNELVIQAIAETVHAENNEKKLEIARKIPITSTARMGKYNSLRTRPIRISFASKSDADLLIERKKKLKQGIYIDREYNEEEETERKLLRPILRAARKHSHYRGKCKLDGTKLVIQGKSYNRSNIENLPEDISAWKISSKESDETIGFFRELNPLSNFHPSTFMYNRVEYSSLEQLIQHQKVKLFDDTELAAKIMRAKSALECKKLSKNIANYSHDRWKTKAKTRCEEGIKAKFMLKVARIPSWLVYFT